MADFCVLDMRAQERLLKVKAREETGPGGVVGGSSRQAKGPILSSYPLHSARQPAYLSLGMVYTAEVADEPSLRWCTRRFCMFVMNHSKILYNKMLSVYLSVLEL